MNTETWSLPLSSSSSSPSSALSSHPSKSYDPIFFSCKTEVSMDIDKGKSLRKRYRQYELRMSKTKQYGSSTYLGEKQTKKMGMKC